MKTTKTTTLAAALAVFASLPALAQEATSTNSTYTNSMAGASAQNSVASPQSYRLGAGVVVGEPTGPTVKYWINDTIAVDGTVGWSLRDNDDIDLNADVLWHNFDLIPVSTGRTAVYVGVGPSIKFRDEEDNRFGVRAPIGISYMLENKPLDVFAEFAPILDVSPDVRGDFTVGIGVRYWF